MKYSPTFIPHGHYISVLEYARRAKITRVAALKRIKSGKIKKVYQVGRSFIIPLPL